MSIKQKIKAGLQKLFAPIKRVFQAISTRWKKMSPGFRYAFVYFMTVVCIASVVWWQYNPGGALVFDPTPSEQQGGQEQEPAQDEDKTPIYAEDPYRDAFADNGSDTGGDTLVFNPEVDKLHPPLPGSNLTPNGYYRYLGSNIISFTDGIHIGGDAGDQVKAAWGGEVLEVTEQTTDIPGRVVLKHGDYKTVYINLQLIDVQVGQVVSKGDVLGTLAKNRTVDSTDFLEFHLMYGDDYLEPQEYLEEAQ